MTGMAIYSFITPLAALIIIRIIIIITIRQLLETLTTDYSLSIYLFTFYQMVNYRRKSYAVLYQPVINENTWHRSVFYLD